MRFQWEVIIILKIFISKIRNNQKVVALVVKYRYNKVILIRKFYKI